MESAGSARSKASASPSTTRGGAVSCAQNCATEPKPCPSTPEAASRPSIAGARTRGRFRRPESLVAPARPRGPAGFGAGFSVLAPLPPLDLEPRRDAEPPRRRCRRRPTASAPARVSRSPRLGMIIRARAASRGRRRARPPRRGPVVPRPRACTRGVVGSEGAEQSSRSRTARAAPALWSLGETTHRVTRASKTASGAIVPLVSTSMSRSRGSAERSAASAGCCRSGSPPVITRRRSPVASSRSATAAGGRGCSPARVVAREIPGWRCRTTHMRGAPRQRRNAAGSPWRVPRPAGWRRSRSRASTAPGVCRGRARWRRSRGEATGEGHGPPRGPPQVPRRVSVVSWTCSDPSGHRAPDSLVRWK
jgi:hypothetical protein